LRNARRGETEGCWALISCGQVSLLKLTETRITNLAKGFLATSSDVQFLLEQINRHFSKQISVKQIVSLRCGIRPLPVELSFSDHSDTLRVPREDKICAAKNLP
jgi:glycerol-3-phosphate dehydrogenase